MNLRFLPLSSPLHLHVRIALLNPKSKELSSLDPGGDTAAFGLPPLPPTFLHPSILLPFPSSLLSPSHICLPTRLVKVAEEAEGGRGKEAASCERASI